MNLTILHLAIDLPVGHIFLPTQLQISPILRRRLIYGAIGWQLVTLGMETHLQCANVNTMLIFSTCPHIPPETLRAMCPLGWRFVVLARRALSSHEFVRT